MVNSAGRYGSVFKIREGAENPLHATRSKSTSGRWPRIFGSPKRIPETETCLPVSHPTLPIPTSLPSPRGPHVLPLVRRMAVSITGEPMAQQLSDPAVRQLLLSLLGREAVGSALGELFPIWYSPPAFYGVFREVRALIGTGTFRQETKVFLARARSTKEHARVPDIRLN